MKKILLATVLAAFGPTLALAADLGERTYTKAPLMAAPASSWTGFYVGADAGYAFNGSSSGVLTNASGRFPLPYQMSLKGGFGGGFVGYNYQIQQFVIGVEADWQAASFSGTSATGFTVDTAGVVSDPLSAASKVKDFGSVRARFGAAFDRLLVFGTAGWAGGSFSTTYRDNGAPFLTNSHRVTDGWAAGVGVEYAFLNNVTGRIEYRHTDLGKTTIVNTTVNTAEQGNSVRLDDVRLGVAYKF